MVVVIAVREWLRGWWGVRTAAALAAASFVAISLAAAGLALVVLQDRAVRASVQEQAGDHAAAAATQLRSGESAVEAVTGSTGFAVLQILDGSGTVLAASPQLDGAPPLPVHGSGPDELDESPGLDEPLLVVREEVSTAAGPLVVLAGGSLAAAERSLDSATYLALVGVPLMAVLAGAATYAFTGWTLRPVEAIRRDVAALGDRDLARRVPEPWGRDEVGRLARTMNDMLARLQAAQAAQRRFVADASHELRSPLATITTRLELGRERGPTAADVAAMEPEAWRMTHLIEDLLLLARADERGLAARHDDVDLDELVELEAEHLRATCDHEVRAETVAVRVTGDRVRLSRMLRNLADNAARHADGRVALDLRLDAGHAVLDVTDDGPGIPRPDRTRVFDRFVRLDEHRGRTTGGAGLGLAIVAEVCRAHGGTVQVRSRTGGGAVLRVRLPVQTPGGGSGSSRIR